MATSYTQVSKGSSGSSVSELQKILNQSGYSLAEDGVFGDKTLAAVKDYQRKNGLDVDGVVGKNTWGTLTNAKKSSSNDKPAASTGFTYDDFTYDDKFEYDKFAYDDYEASDTVTQAMAALNSQLGAKPGEYQSTWQGQINSIINQILNREDFSYDLNSDALYQQYKDQYTQQGKLAMMDTMGQAAALTGGYGSSYASTAGNQAYQAYLSQLNEVVPELYQMALNRYNQEGDALYNNYSLLSDQENQEYGRYQDEYSKWQNELGFLYDQYNTERNFDYNQYATDRDLAYNQYNTDRNFDYSQYVNDRDYAYGVYSDEKSYAYNDYLNKIEQERWQAEYDEALRQYEQNFAYQQERDAVSDSQWNQSYEYQKQRDKVSDSQWQQSFNLSKQQYEEAKKASQTTGNDTVALEHVASMSSSELVETMQDYKADEDNTGLAAFLDDCVASNRLTEAQADEYYSKYRVGSTTVTDTTVKKNTTSKTPAKGGVGGKINYRFE